MFLICVYARESFDQGFWSSAWTHALFAWVMRPGISALRETAFVDDAPEPET